MRKVCEGMDWPTEAALDRLDGEVRAAAARMARAKRQRREARLFALALVCVAAAVCLALWGARGADILWAALAGMGATALFSPVLAYFAEEGTYEREAE